MTTTYTRLIETFRELLPQGVCVAFSGGTDSALLLKAAARAAAQVYPGQSAPVVAVTFQTALHPLRDLENARRVAEEIGISHLILPINVFSDPAMMRNPLDRCYRCKHLLFTRLRSFAAEHHLRHIVDGTNADDLKTHRPGLRALRELGIKQPLAELGFTKDAVRAAAREAGISVSDRPSSPCLATRLPYNTPLEPVFLQRVADGEALLHESGFPIVRLRAHGTLARIELPKDDFDRFLAAIPKILQPLKTIGFQRVTLDVEGFRSGSFDEPRP